RLAERGSRYRARVNRPNVPPTHRLPPVEAPRAGISSRCHLTELAPYRRRPISSASWTPNAQASRAPRARDLGKDTQEEHKAYHRAPPKQRYRPTERNAPFGRTEQRWWIFPRQAHP